MQFVDRGCVVRCARSTLLSLTFLLAHAPLLGCVQRSAPGGQATARGGMVVSVCEHASRTGADVLRKGGNAVDSAVAVAFALAVTYPAAGNIGGGGFMLIHTHDGAAPTCIDYRETAPAASALEMLAHVSGSDARMVGTPGTVRGLAMAHARYGTQAWKGLIQPAIELAEDGFEVNAALARSLNEVLKENPGATGLHAVFAPPQPAREWSAGDRLVQRELAATLREIADEGPDAFYQGRIARQIVAELRSQGGIIEMADLAAYQAVERAPIHGVFRGYDVFAPPPPSSGGVCLIEMLNMLESLDLRRHPRGSAESIHLIAECMRRAFRDRAEFLGDADFVEIPGRLTDKAYARGLAASIDPQHATPSESLAGAIPLRAEGESTTHFSIIDRNGMAVSNTYTLEDSYGSKIVVRGAGFLLNNEMGDFNRRPGVTDRSGRIGTAPNLIAPGKRMLSSQTPVLVTRNGKVVLVTGSPGGRTIINTVLCVVLNALEYELQPTDCVLAPRLHHQWFPDEVVLEPLAPDDVLATGAATPGEQKSARRIALRVGGVTGPTSATLERLRSMGHRVRTTRKGGDPVVQGDAHSIFVIDGIRHGVADRRISGAASAE